MDLEIYSCITSLCLVLLLRFNWHEAKFFNNYISFKRKYQILTNKFYKKTLNIHDKGIF